MFLNRLASLSSPARTLPAFCPVPLSDREDFCRARCLEATSEGSRTKGL
jgi:hypothetical protein